MISRRLRFEILRRDNFTCRYCGACAPNIRLTVDHVLPVSLGGNDESSNLVAACHDCNNGKSSVHPGAVLIDDVNADMLRWRRAIEAAAETMREETIEHQALLDRFDRHWRRWTVHEQMVPRDSAWRSSIERFLALGVPIEKLEHLVDVSMSRPKLDSSKCWAYFCGCCWRTVDELQHSASKLISLISDESHS